MNPGRNARLGVIVFLFIVSVIMVGGGLDLALREQPDLRWIYVGGVSLAFISGFVVAEIGLDYVRRDFQIEIENEQKKAGRPLSKQELEQVRERFREKRKQGVTNIPFPLQRLIARLILLPPALIAVSFAVAVGAFFAGLSLAGLIAEYRKRTISHF